MLSRFSRARHCATLWPAVYQAPLFMEFSRQEYRVGCHDLLQGIFPTQGSNLGLLDCREISLLLSHQGSPFGQLLVTQSCSSLWDPTDCGPPGFSVYGILQARVLEWVAFLLQRIFPTQGSNPSLLCLQHWQAGSLLLVPPGKPICSFYPIFNLFHNFTTVCRICLPIKTF